MEELTIELARRTNQFRAAVLLLRVNLLVLSAAIVLMFVLTFSRVPFSFA